MTPGPYSVVGFWFSVLSVGVWVGDGRRFRDAAPFLCFGLFDALGQGRRPAYAAMRPVALNTPDMGRNPKGQQVRAQLPGVGCTALGRQGGSSSVRCRASRRRSSVSSLPVRPGSAGDHRLPALLSGRGTERTSAPGLSDRASATKSGFLRKEASPERGLGRLRGASQWNVASRASFHRLDGQGKSRDWGGGDGAVRLCRNLPASEGGDRPIAPAGRGEVLGWARALSPPGAGRGDGDFRLCRNLPASQGRATSRSPLREGKGIGMGLGVESFRAPGLFP